MQRKRTDADRKADKKYRAKTIVMSVKYTPTDMIEGNRLKHYLATSGQSANAYIKSLIKADLDSKEIPYPLDRD